MIYTDQHRADALGAAGNSEIHTPNLDRLAQSGTRFTNHFVQHPLCMPSRASTLSGQYPATLGITSMGVPIPESTELISHMLARAGYRCANIGKLHALPHANRDHRATHPDYGFHHLQISEEPGVYPDAYTAWLDRVAPGVSAKINMGLPPARATWNQLMDGTDSAEPRDDYLDIVPWSLGDGLTHTAFVADATIDFVRRQQRAGPFFCIAGFFAPHAPYTVPAAFLEAHPVETLSLPAFSADEEAQRLTNPRFSDVNLRRVKQGYYGAVCEVDHHVGRILDALESLGLTDETVVVFTSDHGEWLGDHLRYAKGTPVDDSVLHVPLVWSGPGIEPTTVASVVEAVDIVPTICALAGVQAPLSLQGQNLFGRTDVATRQSARSEGAGWRSLRTRSHRYTLAADGTETIRCLDQDRHEHHDLGPTDVPAETLSDLRHELNVNTLVAERPLPRTFPY